ncbi:unnamed protein product, partial [Closterium sp. NIES-53]
MASRILVSGLPRSLPPLPLGHAPTCVPCVEGRQPRVRGQGHECYFLLVIDDYSRYTTVFPLRSKGETEVRRIGMVMNVARTSMIHAAAPHFLWPFAVQYAAHQINLQPRVSLPETTPTLRWTGKVGDASAFRVWGSRAFVRDTSADKLSSRAVPCVFLGFPHDAPGWQFYHPTSRRGAEPGGAEPECVESGGAEPASVEPGGAEPERVEPGGSDPGGTASGGAEPARNECGGSLGVPLWREPLSPQRLREWYARHCRRATGAGGATGAAGGTAAVGAARDAAGAGAAGGAAGAGAAGGAAGAGAAGGAAGAGAAGGSSRAGRGPAGVGAAGAADPGDPGAEGTGAVSAVSGGTARPRPYYVPLFQQVPSLPPSLGPTPPLLNPPPVQSQSQLQPASPLPGPSPFSGPTRGLTERREPVSRPVLPESRPASPESRSASPVRTFRAGRRVSRPRPPPVPGTQPMTLRPSTAPQRVPLPSPPASSLPALVDPDFDSLCAASPTVTRFMATAVTDPLFESTAASALVAELLDFAAAYHLDYATSLVAESASASVCPLSIGGECALGTDVLENRQEEFECFAVAVPHLVSMLLAPEGDPDAPDILTPRSYAEAIEGPYSSQWQATMDAEMASWKSTGTYVDEVPPPGANIVSGMWIFRGVDFFQTFSPTLKMATLWVLLHVAAQRDYELHSLDFSTAFLQGSLHEEIWLRRPRGFNGSFPAGTQWSLWRPVYGLCQAPREWHDTLRTTLATLGFASSTADPSLFLRTDTNLPPFYVLVYVDDLVFATADTEALAHVFQRFGFTYSSPQSTPLPTSHLLSAPPLDESVELSGPYPELVGCLMYLMTCTRPDLAYPLSLLARYVVPCRHRKVHWDVAKRVLRYLCSTLGMGLVLGGRARVVLTGHVDASWVDDLATQRSSQGYTFSLGSGSVSWRSTRSSSVLSSSCEAEIYAGAMAAQELRWLTYLLTYLGEAPCSPPVLYVDNKAMLALCQQHRLEHRTKHIALRYFLARELQQRGQLCLAYVASQANTADVFTKALQPCDHQRFCTVLGLLALLFLDWSCGLLFSPTLPMGGPPTVRTAPGAAAVARCLARRALLLCPAQRYRATLPRAALPRAALLPRVLRCCLYYLAHRTLPCSLRAAQLAARSVRSARMCAAYVRTACTRAAHAHCLRVPFPHPRCLRAPCPAARALLPCSPRAALPCSPSMALPCSPHTALPCCPHAALPCCPHALQPARRPALQPARRLAFAACALPCPAAGALPCQYSDYRYFYSCNYSASSGGQQQQQCQANILLPQQLCEWVIQRDRPGGGDYGVMRAGGTGQQRQSRRQETLSPQQLRTGQQPQQRQQETLSPQQPREWVSQRCVPGSAEATSLGVAALRARAAGPGGAGAGGAGAASTGGAGAAGAKGARTRGACTRGAGAAGAGGADAAGAGGAGGACWCCAHTRGAGAAGAGDAGAAGAGGAVGAGGAGSGGSGGVGGAGATSTRGASARGTEAVDGTAPSQTQLPPCSPLPAPSPYIELSDSLTELREPESRTSKPVRARRVTRPRPRAVPDTHVMALRPSSAPKCVALPSPPASSLPDVPDPASDLARAASPTVTCLLATIVIDPSFESTAAFSQVTNLVDFAARIHLEYIASLVTESEFVCPPSVGGEPALSIDFLEDRQFEHECLAAALPCFASMLLCPEGDPDALDIPTPRSYAEAIMGTYADEVPPLGAKIVDGMWIFIVKGPPGSPPAFKARYGSLHEEIWLRRPPSFTGSFPEGTQWSLRRPVYDLRQVPREWHNTLRTTLAGLGFAPSSADPSLFLRTDTSLLPFYILVCVDDLVFATSDTKALALVKAELQERHTCTDLGEMQSYLGLQITRDRAWRTITVTQSHMVHQVLQRFGFMWSSPQPTPLPTGQSLLAPPSDESVEPSGPYPELVGCL